jgi:hypothetical protein
MNVCGFIRSTFSPQTEHCAVKDLNFSRSILHASFFSKRRRHEAGFVACAAVSGTGISGKTTSHDIGAEFFLKNTISPLFEESRDRHLFVYALYRFGKRRRDREEFDLAACLLGFSGIVLRRQALLCSCFQFSPRPSRRGRRAWRRRRYLSRRYLDDGFARAAKAAGRIDHVVEKEDVLVFYVAYYIHDFRLICFLAPLSTMARFRPRRWAKFRD